MKIPQRSRSMFIAASMLGVLLLVGCASTAPKADFSHGTAMAAPIASKDQIKASVEKSGDVDILDVEKTRLAQRIEERIAAKKALNPGADDGKSYEVEVTLTRYQRGNAFARAMLAGLGQIHIDGTVRVYQLPDRTKMSEFSIKKTFAWGGIYGGTTSMEDIERAFAEGVAAAVTGQKEETQKKT